MKRDTACKKSFAFTSTTQKVFGSTRGLIIGVSRDCSGVQPMSSIMDDRYRRVISDKAANLGNQEGCCLYRRRRAFRVRFEMRFDFLKGCDSNCGLFTALLCCSSTCPPKCHVIMTPPLILVPPLSLKRSQHIPRSASSCLEHRLQCCIQDGIDPGRARRTSS